ncbi:MAG: 4Fe-4S binding protein [Proteobacteria bacterium]|nr:4Fe-4S binding protein [Pseudomonadota bacterium]
MARHRRTILALQWAIVLFYALLVVLPAFLPQPHPEARLFSGGWGAASYVDGTPCTGSDCHQPLQAKAPYVAQWYERLVLLAQYLFWGVWWPFVILSIMLMGRMWCGVLCPEGALSEWASRHGRGGAIPRWLRWGGWPVLAFILTTVYGQLISVYEYPQAALLILGGSTVAAMAVGWMYGRGKRVWCRYLCPVSGVFALLARIAPLHFKLDREAWLSFPGRTPAVDCPPLLQVGQLASMSQCHACGRCSGHRDAMQLQLRSPEAEILAARPASGAELTLLLYGVLGVAMGAFQWTVSPWFVRAKQAAAEWLVAREIFWPLDTGAPWWLLTQYPDNGDAFTWLDGAAVLAYIGCVALLLGSWLAITSHAAGRLARTDWRALALALVPLAGMGLFLGLSMMTVSHLRAEGVALSWLPWARALLLALGSLWSWSLGTRLLLRARAPAWRLAMALAAWTLAVASVSGTWVLVFYVW